MTLKGRKWFQRMEDEALQNGHSLKQKGPNVLPTSAMIGQ